MQHRNETVEKAGVRDCMEINSGFFYTEVLKGVWNSSMFQIFEFLHSLWSFNKEKET